MESRKLQVGRVVGALACGGALSFVTVTACGSHPHVSSCARPLLTLTIRDRELQIGSCGVEYTLASSVTLRVGQRITARDSMNPAPYSEDSAVIQETGRSKNLRKASYKAVHAGFTYLDIRWGPQPCPRAFSPRSTLAAGEKLPPSQHVMGRCPVLPIRVTNALN